MYFICTFRNRPKSERALIYAKEKLQDVVEKYTRAPVGIDLAFQTVGVKDSVRMTFQADRFFSVALSAQGYGIYHAIDNLVAKLKNLLRKKKEKFKDPKAKRDRFELVQLEASIDDDEVSEAIDAEDVIKFEEARLKRLAYF